MSHEIRTPMNGIVGMAELLCDSALSDDQRLYAETIRSSGDALLAIINDILDMSKAEADRLRLYPVPMTLADCLSEVTRLVQSSVRDKGLALSLDIDPALPDRFIADPLRLRQVMTNLVGNAVKFTATGHVAVRAFGCPEEEGVWAITICVEDSGIGIAAADQHMIFGEFDQVETETSRQYQGTGLGLAIVSQLVRLMQGQIRVDSALGAGACFRVQLRLPLAPDAQVPTPPPLPPHLRRVLIVSDHHVRARLLGHLLTDWGLEVGMVPDPAAAMTILGGGGIDAVLTDHMPEEDDAPTLAALLAAARLAMPLILMTACPEAVAAGPDAAAFAALLDLPPAIPALRAALAQLGPPAVMAPALSMDETARPLRVLAAEDNRTNQLVLRKMLEPLGIELQFAQDGQAAVDLWRQWMPDLIFMDVSMPVMDGIEATRRIRRAEARTGTAGVTGGGMGPDRGNPPGAGTDDQAGVCGGDGDGPQSDQGAADDPVSHRRVAIIALTAHPSEAIGPSLQAAGADDCLPKPFRRADLIGALIRFAPADTRPLCDPSAPTDAAA